MKETYVKNIELEMSVVPEICPNKIMPFGEKCPGREQGETAKLSNSTLPVFLTGRKESIEKQSQQPNAEI